MDKRLYFVVGDLAANIVTGALVGWLVWLATPHGWNMWLIMAPAMILGMVLATVLAIPLGMLFGAMEVMVPMMLSGMVAGMVLGMHAAMHRSDAAFALATGALCGLASILAVWALNSLLRGPRPLPAKVRRG
ncbi:MAG: hypothetical protein ACK5HY_14680 [Parahaliea sp.]